MPTAAPETLRVLANLAASFLLLLAFLSLSVVTVALAMLWRGLKLGRAGVPHFAPRLVEYARRVEAETRHATAVVLEPQVRLLSQWAGVKAGMRAFVSGTFGGPAGGPPPPDS